MKLVYRYHEDLTHESEAQDIVDRLAAIGVTITRQDAHLAWEGYSREFCSPWLALPDDDCVLLRAIKAYCDEAA